MGEELAILQRRIEKEREESNEEMLGRRADKLKKGSCWRRTEGCCRNWKKEREL